MGDISMEKEIYAPEWVVSSDYCEHPCDEHQQWIEEYNKKSTKEICEEIAESKKS